MWCGLSGRRIPTPFFSSINFPYLAVIQDGILVRYIREEPCAGIPGYSRIRREFYTEINHDVLFTKRR